MKLNQTKNKIAGILRKSEKWTGTDMVYITKHGFWITLANIVNNLLGLLVLLAFANFLPKDIYGTYRYILSFMGFFSFTTLPGMRTAVTRSVARSFEGSIIPAVKTKIKYGLLGGLAALLFGFYYIYNHNITLGYGLIVLAIFIPFYDAGSIINGLFNGRKLFKQASLISIFTKIFYIAVMASTIYLTDNLFIVLFAYLISNTLMNYSFYIIGIFKYKINDNKDPDMIPYGKNLTYIQIISNIAGAVDKVLIFHFFGAVQLAVYSFATILPDKIKILIGIMNKMAMPKFSQGDGQAAKAALPKKVLKFVFILVPVAGLYIILAPFIYKILLPQYLDSVFYSQIYVISILVYPQMFLRTYLQARMKTKQLYILTSITPMVRIALYTVLIPLYGIIGAIMAFMLVRTFNFGFQFYLFKKS